MMDKLALLKAVQAAQKGDWDTAHQIAQDDNSSTANWIHAVLHKIEGDEWNSQYWYGRSGGHQYHDFSDIKAELAAIARSLI
ncbi:MAG: hypothetical protein CTY38_04575 [Methylotenera sp.]|nr:MAG: hypothetical protein CTY38_04575 [Methylotenera sp.]